MLVFLALIFGVPETPAQPAPVYVSREQFDCFVRDARNGFTGKQTYYLDRRACPPVVTRAPKRFGLYPRVGRPTPPASIYPNIAGTTRSGQPYKSVVALSGAELNCLANPRQRRAVVRPVSGDRYELAFSACR